MSSIISLAIAAIAITSFAFIRPRLRGKGKPSGFMMSWWHILFIVAIVFASCMLFGDNCTATQQSVVLLIYLLTCSFLGLIVFTLWRYKQIFKYTIGNKLDTINHMMQLSILVSIAVLIVLTIFFFRLNDKSFLPFSLFAVVLTWLFQDAVVGVAAYIHLRMNKLLHIGDLITIPERDITGYVADISLVSVTIDRLDNTRSSIPIVTLQKGAFTNLTEMIKGNKSGRRLLRSFIIDNNSIAPCTEAEIEQIAYTLLQKGENSISLHTEKEALLGENGKNEVLNLYLFRRYLRHWLWSNYEVARTPRMIVSVSEPTVEGVPLKVYVYIKQPHLETFEHISSEITEHIIHSMQWFGLRLYQRPTSADLKTTLTTSAENESIY